MSLRDQMRIDVQKVFLNPMEFAELHTWQSNVEDPRTIRSLPMIIETFTLDGHPMTHIQGVTVYNAVVHVSQENLTYTPSRGEGVRLDGKYFEIDNVSNEFGMIKVMLVGNRS